MLMQDACQRGALKVKGNSAGQVPKIRHSGESGPGNTDNYLNHNVNVRCQIFGTTVKKLTPHPKDDQPCELSTYRDRHSTIGIWSHTVMTIHIWSHK